MTPEEYARSLRAISKGIAEKRVCFLAATGTMAEMSRRIWDEGKLTDGSKLTYNDDRPIYAYKPPSPKQPSGKGKTGKKIKGGYYANYSAYKAGMGRPNMPFELTGEMRQAWLGGASPKPTEVSALEVVITMDPANVRKADGLAKMKGEFLRLTDAEIASHTARVERIYRREVLGQ